VKLAPRVNVFTLRKVNLMENRVSSPLRVNLNLRGQAPLPRVEFKADQKNQTKAFSLTLFIHLAGRHAIVSNHLSLI
jgi:hypothetical protein